MFTKVLIILVVIQYSYSMAIPTTNCICLGLQGFCDCEETPVYIDNCDRSLEYTLVPGTCDQYYICRFNGLSIITCGSGYQFDSVYGMCRPAEQVKCGVPINTDWEGEDNQTIDIIWK